MTDALVDNECLVRGKQLLGTGWDKGNGDTMPPHTPTGVGCVLLRGDGRAGPSCDPPSILAPAEPDFLSTAAGPGFAMPFGPAAIGVLGSPLAGKVWRLAFQWCAARLLTSVGSCARAKQRAAQHAHERCNAGQNR